MADYCKRDPLCDLTYLRKMAKRGLLEVVEADAPAKPAKAPKAKAVKPEAKPAKAKKAKA